MNNDPYAKRYNLFDIKAGLSFYYNLLDQIDPLVFTKDAFPIKRAEIISTLKYLNYIPEDHKVCNLVQSHPFLTEAMDSIQSFEDKETKPERFEASKYLIIIWIENLLFSACFVLFQKFQIDFSRSIEGKKNNEIIKGLIEIKAKLQNNIDSYSRRFTKFVFDYILNFPMFKTRFIY